MRQNQSDQPCGGNWASEVQVPMCTEQQGQLEITQSQPPVEGSGPRKKDHETSRSSLGPGALNTVSCLVALTGDEAKMLQKIWDSVDLQMFQWLCYMGKATKL